MLLFLNPESIDHITQYIYSLHQLPDLNRREKFALTSYKAEA